MKFSVLRQSWDRSWALITRDAVISRSQLAKKIFRWEGSASEALVPAPSLQMESMFAKNHEPFFNRIGPKRTQRSATVPAASGWTVLQNSY
jgi:hypothetical protein